MAIYTVLVSIGERRRPVTFDNSEDTELEHQALEQAICSTFHDVLCAVVSVFTSMIVNTIMSLLAFEHNNLLNSFSDSWAMRYRCEDNMENRIPMGFLIDQQISQRGKNSYV